MTVLNDEEITQLAMCHGMIEPFVEEQIRRKVQGDDDGRVINNGLISYGLSSYGYDIRLANQFKIFSAATGTVTILDPKRFDPKAFVDFEGDECLIPPNSFVLGYSVEWIRMPENVLAFCVGKSSYARCGLNMNFTPFEPGWEGHVTIEISNTTSLYAKVYANEGIAQVVFLQGTPCKVSYRTRQGKYQGQRGITLPRL